AFPERPARAEADVALAPHPSPGSLGNGERDLRAEARHGALRVAVERLERVECDVRPGVPPRLLQALHAEIVLRTHQQGMAEGNALALEGPLEKRQVLARELLLERAREGGDDDPTRRVLRPPGGVQDRRDEIGERLPDPGPRLDEQVTTPGEAVG